MGRYKLTTSIVLAIAVTNILPLRANDELVTRFREEAPKAWREYHSYAKRLEGNVYAKSSGTKSTWRGEREQIKHYEEIYRWEFKQNANCRLCVYQLVSDEDSMGTVYAFNPTYGFELQRINPSAPWFLARVESSDMANDAASIRNILKFTAYTGVLVKSGSVPLWELVELPTFQVKRAVSKTQGSEHLVEIEFDNPHTPTNTPSAPGIQSGVLLLAPNHHWCLRAWQLRILEPDREVQRSAKLEWEIDGSGYPIPRRKVMNVKIVAPSYKLNYDMTWDYTFWEADNSRSDDEFTMAAFGLPEPFDIAEAAKKRRGMPLFAWVVIAASVCGVLALAFLWLRKRASS